MTFDPDKALDAAAQAAARPPVESSDWAEEPPDSLWAGMGWWRRRFVRWLLLRPSAIGRYLGWYFTFPIEHERKLVEFALAVLKHDPEKLLQWENERNLTKMRNKTGRRLMAFLALETALLFALVALQGFKWNGFSLDNTFFTVFVNATIIQVAGLVLVVVMSLFPRLSKDKHPAEDKVGILQSADSVKSKGPEPEPDKPAKKETRPDAPE